MKNSHVSGAEAYYFQGTLLPLLFFPTHIKPNKNLGKPQFPNKTFTTFLYAQNMKESTKYKYLNAN